MVGGEDGAVEGVGGAEVFMAAAGAVMSKSPMKRTLSPDSETLV